MLYVKAYNEKLQQCIIVDTADDTVEKVGVSEVRKVVNRGIQIPGVYQDKIEPVTEEQAVEQKLALLRLMLGNDAIEVNNFGKYIEIDCSDVDKLILPDISYQYKLKGNDNVSVELAPDWEIISKYFLRESRPVEIIIPDSATSIRDFAFRDCDYLKNIIIPDSVISIGDSAFKDCRRLESITIPDSVTSIGAYAFRDCTYLENIEIPDSVTSIGAYAFLNTLWLQKKRRISPLVIVNNILVDGKTASGNVKVPNNVIDISASAFIGSEIKCITIPYGITSIKRGTFEECKSLWDVDIPDSVTSIGAGAFCRCSSLEEIIIPNGVISIGDYAFMDCSSLEYVKMPNSVISIGDRAFENCKSLYDIVIPDSITDIGCLAFLGCRKLKAIKIPDSVIYIGDEAFEKCLRSLTICCSKGSYAEEYAIENNLKYRIVG